MINKKVDSIEEALKGVSDHMTFMLGGFGLCGIPENAIAELVRKGVKILLVYLTMQELMILDLDYYYKISKLRK